MSRDYILTCFNCRVYLSFGKVYWMDENNHPLDDVTLDGVFEDESRQWHKRDEYFGKTVEKFLILHRNHEIRFVPEGVDELLEDSLGYIDSVEGDELLKKKVEPEVDWWREKEIWMDKLNSENS